MVSRIASLTLVALLLTDSFTGRALTRPGDESKQNPFDQWMCDGEENDREDDRNDHDDLFAASSSVAPDSLAGMSCVSNDGIGMVHSARRLASPRGPPIVSC